MDRSLSSNPLRDFTLSWIIRRATDFGPLAFHFVDSSHSSITLNINSRLLQLLVPSSFHVDGSPPSAPKSPAAEEVFLVTVVQPDPEFDDLLANTVMVLNEKLERVVMQPNALSEVLDHILLAFREHESRVQAKMIENIGEPSWPDAVDGSDDSDGCDWVDFPDDVFHDSCGYYVGGHLSVMAEMAKLQCELAFEAEKSGVGASDFRSKFLQWCVVTQFPNSGSVDLFIYLGGLVHSDVGMSVLGLALDAPVKISLKFGPESWQQRNHKSSGCKMQMEILVSQGHSSDHLSPLRSDIEKRDLRSKRGQMHFYGSDVLLPELIRVFIDFHAERNITAGDHVLSEELLNNLEKYAAIENVFVGLLCFLCARFIALPNWCLICWKSFPFSICRIRTCNREFCLYRFEELGLGSCVLTELRKSSEIIDFELSLAQAAATSSRDVFEPFPTFLLEKEEMRDRSGWFSEAQIAHSSTAKKKRTSQATDKRNKNLILLKAILETYPPLMTMIHCQDEVALKESLNVQWEDAQGLNKNVTREWQRQKQTCLKSRTWLPYDVLWFVLSTSRHTLHPLQGDHKLSFSFDTCYQFAVLHDSPEREAGFERRKIEKGGSFFAFHGSASENWFSILRNGLRCLSDTPLMSSGAAHGTGIYLSPSMGVSMGYCKASAGWQKGSLAAGFCVIAICEVINGSIRDQQNGARNGSRAVVVKPECETDVAIRYLIVFQYTTSQVAVTINGSILSGYKETDLMSHYQSLKSAYALKQEEQQQIWRAACRDLLADLHNEMKTAEELDVQDGSSSTPMGADYSHADNQTSPAKDAGVTAKNKVDQLVPSSTALQAISREYKNIQKQIRISRSQNSLRDDDMPILAGISVSIADESDICRWQVELNQGLFKRFPLYKDLTDCARIWDKAEVGVKLEFVFPPDFPYAPPFVRVVSPRFGFHTGHVTVGGSICMELLTESGWSPACSFESVVVQIVNAMIEGEGRLDMEACRMKSEYSEYEARRAFDRVAHQHGWRVPASQR